MSVPAQNTTVLEPTCLSARSGHSRTRLRFAQDTVS